MRLGCLPYLNVKPLVYPFEHGGLPQGWELVYEPPSVLAKMLLKGEIGAAPVSSFACFRDRELWAVPRICIASQGAVKSVLMVSKVPIRDVSSVALDTSSLSGAAMLRILLQELYKISPDYVPRPPDAKAMLESCDAALLIGNPAMLMDKTGLYVLDLGADWLELTGLPAVFAVWAGRQENLTRELNDRLLQAKDEGCSKLAEISRTESVSLGLPFDVCYDYLANVMRYDMDWPEIQSLDVFARKCWEHGLLEAEPELRVAERG